MSTAVITRSTPGRYKEGPRCPTYVVYGCQGCGKSITSSEAIQYEAKTPYQHSKWFCDIGCVLNKHEAILRYALEGKIDYRDDWTQAYLRGLTKISTEYEHNPELHVVVE